MATGEQPSNKGVAAAIIAALAAILVAVFGNFQNIFGGEDLPKTAAKSAPSTTASAPSIQASTGAVVITNSSAGRDIKIDTNGEQKK